MSPKIAPSPPPRVAFGTVVAERYRIDALLGEGGMGTVYRATHVHMRKSFALKVLLPEWTGTPEVVARFAREAVAAGRISHPNVAAATDFGQLPDGSFFLVLEYVEGTTLRQALGGGAFEPARALRVLRGVTQGVAAAHALGIVHRDLKPENVLLVERNGDRDFPKVLDFGIAKLHEANGSGPLTNAGAVLGTPDYMAPEQALGGTVDARADLYALGVMLYELLAGECPFRGGALTLLRQHVMNEVPPLPATTAARVSPAVSALVARLMQKEASARLGSAAELIDALDAALLDLDRPTSSVPQLPATDLAAASARLATSVRGVAVSTAGATPPPPRRRAQLLFAGVGGLIFLTAILVRTSSPSAQHAGGAPASSGTPSSDTAAPPDSETPAEPSLPPPPSPRELARGTSVAHAEASASGAASSAPAPSATTGRKRRTGPGGIYIPPPSQWFR